MNPAPLQQLAFDLSALGRPSQFFEGAEDRIPTVLSQLRSNTTRVAELLFLDDVLEALGAPPDVSTTLQIQIRLDLHTRPDARTALACVCNRLNQSLGRIGIFPHSESGLAVVRSLVAWTDRAVPAVLVEGILDSMDAFLEASESVLLAVAQERMTPENAESSLAAQDWSPPEMQPPPWQDTTRP